MLWSLMLLLPLPFRSILHSINMFPHCHFFIIVSIRSSNLWLAVSILFHFQYVNNKRVVLSVGCGFGSCLICLQPFKKGERRVNNSPDGQKQFVSSAEEWVQLTIPFDHERQSCTKVLENVQEEDGFGAAHKTCKNFFRNLLKAYQKNFPAIQLELSDTIGINCGTFIYS